jgi:hypothetical protein
MPMLVIHYRHHASVRHLAPDMLELDGRMVDTKLFA